MTRPYTPAQRAAMEWLPSDGSWRSKPDLAHVSGNALFSLTYLRVAERAESAIGPRGGKVLRFRLTLHGVAEKARLAAEMEKHNET